MGNICLSFVTNSFTPNKRIQTELTLCTYGFDGSGTRLNAYAFEVCATLVNLGAVGFKTIMEG